MESFFYLATPCPPHYPLPFTALITAGWIILALLGLELAVAIGSVVAAPMRWRAVIALALLLGAPIALGLLFSLQRQNLALCLIPGDIHATPQTISELEAAYTRIVDRASAQAHATFLAIVAIALLGALATLATLPHPRRRRTPGAA